MAEKQAPQAGPVPQDSPVTPPPHEEESGEVRLSKTDFDRLMSRMDSLESQRSDAPQGDDSELQRRIADLELQLAQQRAGTDLGVIPLHGAGPGTDMADTWSQWDQGLAYTGDHPLQQEENGD